MSTFMRRPPYFDRLSEARADLRDLCRTCDRTTPDRRDTASCPHHASCAVSRCVARLEEAIAGAKSARPISVPDMGYAASCPLATGGSFTPFAFGSIDRRAVAGERD